MQLSEFDFPFDSSLIAARPSLPRDHARLLVLQRDDRSIAHRRVDELADLLQPGDLLVVNNTKVLAARVAGRKRLSGAEVEILFVKDLGDAIWEVLIKGTFRHGQILEMGAGAVAVVVERGATRTTVRVESPIPLSEWLRQYGRMPLPPYMKRAPTDQDREWYQTLFAQHEGAIAAPTAGLHFTPELLARLQQRGVGLATVTLHVAACRCWDLQACDGRSDRKPSDGRRMARSRNRNGGCHRAGSSDWETNCRCRDHGGTRTRNCSSHGRPDPTLSWRNRSIYHTRVSLQGG